ncbi:MAG: hypothetical protein EOP61_20990 [Sphingomonadales bacterium]|nr:MAG: hypothetical protein EOP61_20990 [Sphingomonadales bacterium]
MRFGVAIGLMLALGACGPQAEAPKPAELVAAVEAAPVELGETQSTIDCPLEKAIYSEPQAGWELRFRAARPWELTGMTEAVMELVRKDGTALWGDVASNMGTSRDVGVLFHGCERPGADDEDLTEAQYDACRQWDGVMYSLNKGEPGYMPGEGANAPERILMTDIGRKLRYSDLVDGPGGEPWDVFDFARCAK